jgi:hypothetical protein
MAEPTSASIGAVATATGIITLTGSVMGLQYDALLIGLFGGLISLMHISAGGKIRTAGSLAAAAVCAAVLSPVAHYAYPSVEWLPKIPAEAFRIPAAFLIGLTSQIAVPLGLEWLGSFLRARTPSAPKD